jgi:hypothetical protein
MLHLVITWRHLPGPNDVAWPKITAGHLKFPLRSANLLLPRIIGSGGAFTSVVSMVDLRTANLASSSRHSRHINRKPASNLYHAIRIADVLGTPLNHLVTVNFDKTECRQENASSTWQRLLARHFAPWTRRPPKDVTVPVEEPAYVWVLENAGGLALHWLVHVPNQRFSDFSAKLENWLTTVGATPTDTGAIDIRNAKNPRGAGYYLLKGVNPAYAGGFGVMPIPQGNVIGKRSGFSRSLGPSRKLALRAAGQYSRRRYVDWSAAPVPRA